MLFLGEGTCVAIGEEIVTAPLRVLDEGTGIELVPFHKPSYCIFLQVLVTYTGFLQVNVPLFLNCDFLGVLFSMFCFDSKIGQLNEVNTSMQE